MELKKTSKADLQNKKTLFFEIGLTLSLLFVLVAFNWTSKEKGEGVLVAQHEEIVEEEEQVPITQQEPPPPIELPKIPQIPEEILVVDDDVVIPTMDLSESESNDNLFQDMAYVEKKQQVVQDVEEVEETIPFAIVEEKPKFQGKDASAFTKWIYSLLEGNYPQVAQENNIQGTVRVSFTVNTDGTLSDIKSIRKVDPILEEAVIELVKKSPK
ncbi:MAG: TonB family protein, partial [Prevotellaceae bacterium]|nr:TonB family protein [Prevotellaceae bacterium]